MAAKRKYTWRDKEPVSVPEPEPVVPPIVEEKLPEPPKVVLCDCGNPANPGDHQCWRCSHRT